MFGLLIHYLLGVPFRMITFIRNSLALNLSAGCRRIKTGSGASGSSRKLWRLTLSDTTAAAAALAANRKKVFYSSSGNDELITHSDVMFHI